MARVRGLRGATTVEQDTSAEVIESTAELIQEMMQRNGLDKADLITIIFTATPDITSEFPAAAARKIGISDIPLLCATELNVKGAIPKVIRILMHIYTNRDYESIRHVYLRGAKPLRTDLPQ
ncbi:MAG: chorismate mutase [Actinomycetota bacterium]